MSQIAKINIPEEELSLNGNVRFTEYRTEQEGKRTNRKVQDRSRNRKKRVGSGTNRIDRKRSGSNRICSKCYIDQERKLHIRNTGFFISEQDESGANLMWIRRG